MAALMGGMEEDATERERVYAQVPLLAAIFLFGMTRCLERT
jgi:hypothetical protein